MSKLPKEHQFTDLSDYGRPIARVIANSLKSTKFTPIDVTIAFVISGLIGVYCIILGYYWTAAFFLILKSILDAADGELARVKETPSYTGRFLDSFSDIILNFIILATIGYLTNTHFGFIFLAFFGIQLQGTLYNYYYVILEIVLLATQQVGFLKMKHQLHYPEKNKKMLLFSFLYTRHCMGFLMK